MSDSDSDVDFDPHAPLDASEEEPDHDVVVAVDDIADFLSTQPREYWPKTKDELYLFISSFARVPFELQPDEIIPFLVISKILVPGDDGSEELVFDLDALRKLDLAQADKLVDHFEASIEAIMKQKKEKSRNKDETSKKSKAKGKEKQGSSKSEEEDSESTRLKPLRALIYKRILSWLRYNVEKLEKHQKNMKQLFDTLKGVSRIHIEIDDRSLIIEALKSSYLLEFSDEPPSDDTDASKKKKKKKSESSSKSKDAKKDGKYVIWNDDEIDTETPLSRRGQSMGLNSLVPSSPLSALGFALIFFLLYGSAILRTDVFSRIMDDEL